MRNAWVQLECPNCEETWEANPSDLPAPRERSTCNHCDATFRTAEFMKTGRDLEILEGFHE